MSSRNFSVVATFEDRSTADRAAQDLARRGLPASHVRVVRSGATRDPAAIGELRAEMQDEVSNALAGPSIGLFTPEQAKGAFPGAVVGGVIGLVLGAAVGLIWAAMDNSPISEMARLVIPAVSAMVAGGTIGFIAGGALKPRMEFAKDRGATMDEPRAITEGATLVEVQAADQHEAEMAHEVLENAGAERVDDLDASHDPVPPQSRDPRPADPEGWWQNGGRGKG